MAQRTYQAIDKTIDGLRISEFDAVSNLLAQPFNENNEYGVGRYVSYEGVIYQKTFETKLINKIKQPYETQLEGNPCTINGITWTVNSIGGIIANGTATEDSYYTLNGSNRVSMGTFSLSGCPSNGSSSSYHLIAHFIIPPTAEIDGGTLLLSYGENIFDLSTITQGVRLERDGTFPEVANGWVSDYIEVNENSHYYVVEGIPSPYVVCYDTSKNYLGSVDASEYTTLLNNTEYIRITGQIQTVSAAEVKEVDGKEGEAVEGGVISPWTFSSETVDGGQIGAWENYFDIADEGDGITFELKESMNISSYELYCVIKEGASVDNIIFYPQLEEGSSTSHYQTPNRLVEPWIREHWQYVEPDELGITEKPPQVII